MLLRRFSNTNQGRRNGTLGRRWSSVRRPLPDV